MDIATIFEKYGWLAVIVIWLLPKAWQFFADRFYPERVKERIARERADREAKATLMKAQIEREDRESLQRMKLDERLVIAVEQTNTYIQSIILAVNVGNERIAALIAAHTQHANFQFGAHVELKESIEDIKDAISVRQKVDDLEKDLRDTQERMKSVRVEGKSE